MTKRDAMDRWVAFWRRQMPDRILAMVGVKSRSRRPSAWQTYIEEKGLKTERSYDRPPVFEDLHALLEQYKVRYGGGFDPDAEKPVKDDGVGLPTACPTVHFGEGVVGALFGGRLKFASTDVKTESICEPVVTDWAQLDGLKFDEENPWLRRVLDCLRFFVRHAWGRFVLQPYCTIDALNFVVVMRGTTQAFLDVLVNRAEVRRLMEIGLDAAVRYWNLQRGIVEENNKAVIRHDEYASMCPGHAGAGLSVDAYGLCSPSVYEEMGFEFTQRLIDALGGGFLHVHSNGAHLVPLVGRLKGLTELTLGDDPHCERYFPRLREIRECTGDLPLRVTCTIEEFTGGLKAGTLPGGVAYTVQGGLDSVDVANRLMDRVREYRAQVGAHGSAPEAAKPA